MFSLTFVCYFPKACFFEHEWYIAGEKDVFHIFLTADSFSMAYDRALSYINDHCEKADVSILSLSRVDIGDVDA